MKQIMARPISIGIPFYNSENFLADAIRSIFAQTFQDWELILVDDGSRDDSLDIAHAVDNREYVPDSQWSISLSRWDNK